MFDNKRRRIIAHRSWRDMWSRLTAALKDSNSTLFEWHDFG